MTLLDEMQDKIDGFPSALNERRQKIGKSLTACEKTTGIADTTLSRFFKSQSKSPNFYSVVALCQSLDFPVMDYFFGKKEPEKTEAETQIMLMEKDIEYLTKREESLLKIVDDLKKSRNHMFYMNLISVAVFFIIFIVCDLINPYFGIIYRL